MICLFAQNSPNSKQESLLLILGFRIAEKMRKQKSLRVNSHEPQKKRRCIVVWFPVRHITPFTTELGHPPNLITVRFMFLGRQKFGEDRVAHFKNITLASRESKTQSTRTLRYTEEQIVISSNLQRR